VFEHEDECLNEIVMMTMIINNTYRYILIYFTLVSNSLRAMLLFSF